MSLTETKIAVYEVELVKINARIQACLSFPNNADMQIEANLLDREVKAITYQLAKEYHKFINYMKPNMSSGARNHLKERITELLDGRTFKEAN